LADEAKVLDHESRRDRDEEHGERTPEHGVGDAAVQMRARHGSGARRRREGERERHVDPPLARWAPRAGCAGEADDQQRGADGRGERLSSDEHQRRHDQESASYTEEARQHTCTQAGAKNAPRQSARLSLIADGSRSSHRRGCGDEQGRKGKQELLPRADVRSGLDVRREHEQRSHPDHFEDLKDLHRRHAPFFLRRARAVVSGGADLACRVIRIRHCGNLLSAGPRTPRWSR
jgi:hypothetical protein